MYAADADTNSKSDFTSKNPIKKPNSNSPFNKNQLNTSMNMMDQSVEAISNAQKSAFNS